MLGIRPVRLSLCLSAAFAAALLLPPTVHGGAITCGGDCNGDGRVTVNEITLGVAIVLGLQPLSNCEAMDGAADGAVTIDDLLRAVNAALSGCPPTATPTEPPPSPATATPSSVATTTPSTPPTTEPTSPGVATATPTPTAPSTASATPTATSPPATETPTTTPASAPSALVARIEGDLVVLSWINPDPASGFTQVRLLRQLNAPVAGPDDPTAVVVYSGGENEVGDPVTGLLPDVPETVRTYYYAVYGCQPGGDCEPNGTAQVLTPGLAALLRAGGYVIHWRHADADVCADNLDLGTAETTAVPDWWKSCNSDCPTATARQLSDAGRTHATAIGAAFDTLGLPVGRVVTSEYCRNVQTAELMDFGPPLERSPAITYFVYDEANRCDHAFDLLGEVPAGATNTALIGHAGNVCPPLSTLAWSEAAIYKPGGAGASTFITRLTWDQWAALIPPGPTALAAAVDGAAVRLNWSNPAAGSGYTGVRVLRRLNAPVEGADDPQAAEVYAGTAEQAFDDLHALLPDAPPFAPHTYHYAVYACFGPSACETAGSATAFAPTVVEALRAGGYVIHWRHADADVCADAVGLGSAAMTSVPNWWKSCDSNCETATARQLSDAGRMHATAIGAAFDARAIPVGRVVSSEFCRNVQTAELMDFGPPIEQSPAITYFVYDENDRCAHAYELLAEAPATGTNTALIGHAGNSCTVLSDLAWSEAAIYKPDGQGGQTLIARVRWDQWETLP